MEEVKEVKKNKKKAVKTAPAKPKKVWVYFTIKSARGKDKVCLPYALAKKLEKSGNVKIIGE